MLHLLMPSMSDGASPASSRASFAASSAVTSSDRPMFFEKGSWPMPTIAALSLSDTGPHVAQRRDEDDLVGSAPDRWDFGRHDGSSFASHVSLVESPRSRATAHLARHLPVSRSAAWPIPQVCRVARSPASE